MNVAQSGLVITVSEPSPDARQYAYAAEKLQVTGEYVEMIDIFDGGELQPDSFAFDFNIDGLTGSYSDTPGTNRSFVAAVAAKTFAYDINNTGPYIGQSKQSSTAQDVVINGTVTLPATFDLMAMENPGQMADALRDGLAVSVNFAKVPAHLIRPSRRNSFPLASSWQAMDQTFR